MMLPTKSIMNLETLLNSTLHVQNILKRIKQLVFSCKYKCKSAEETCLEVLRDLERQV